MSSILFALVLTLAPQSAAPAEPADAAPSAVAQMKAEAVAMQLLVTLLVTE